jgi:hypothetical protein
MTFLGFDISQIFSDVTTPNEKDFLVYGEGLSSELKKEIDQLFEVLVSTSAAEIISNATTSISIGKKISIIHPFSGWEYILSNPKRKEDLKILLTKYQEDKVSSTKGWFDLVTSAFKIDDKIVKISRQKTVEGFPAILRTRNKFNHLKPHLEEFCHKLSLNKEHITKLIDEDNFEEFIEVIIFN